MAQGQRRLHLEIEYLGGRRVDHTVPGDDSQHVGRTNQGGRLQSVQTVRYGGHADSVTDVEGVGDAFKSDAQAAYGQDKTVDRDHEPVDWNDWGHLDNDVLDEVGADPNH